MQHDIMVPDDWLHALRKARTTSVFRVSWEVLRTAQETGTWSIPASWVDDADVSERTKLRTLRWMAKAGMIDLQEGRDPTIIIPEPYQWHGEAA
jgi:hypothetical protein